MRHFLDQHSSGNSLHQSLLPYRWLPSLITLPAWDLHAFEFPPSVPKGLEHGLDALDDLTFVCFPIRSSIPSLPACWPRQSLPPQADTTAFLWYQLGAGLHFCIRIRQIHIEHLLCTGSRGGNWK